MLENLVLHSTHNRFYVVGLVNPTYWINQSQALNAIQCMKSKNESVEVMKKVFQILAVSVAVFYMSVLPVCSSCPIKLTENITGAACSIQEANNLQKSKPVKNDIGSMPNSKRDLRPVRMSPEIQKSNAGDCLFGMCVHRMIWDK